MLVVCAWCQRTLGEKPPLEDKSVTHTICPDCLKKYFGKTPLKENLKSSVTIIASTEPSQFSFKVAPAKIQQIMEAGRRQLIPEEYEELEALLTDLEIYGFTPWINAQLGKLMSKLTWELEIAPSPEWEEALIACDRAFLGKELRDMCEDAGVSPIGHKKQLCAKLYQREVPEVVEIMEPYLKEKTTERQAAARLPQTLPYVSPLRQMKDRLEDLYRTNPEEFYLRKGLIQKAIKERERGVQKTMPGFNLNDLQSILDFTTRLYR